MSFWNRHRKPSPPRSSTLGLEKLEDRMLLSGNSIAIESGRTVRFVDSDGTRVAVRLIGPGQGTLELTNGQVTGGDIENLTLQGTTDRSQLRITARGGSIGGTTINELVIEKALNELGALKRLVATKLDFVAGGHLAADGDIADIDIRNVGANAEIAVAGNVKHLKARSLQADASIDVSGWLQRLKAENIFDGAEVAAATLDRLTVRHAQGATFAVGAGGIREARITNIHSSVISSQGDIGRVTVQGDIIATSLACNITVGTDGVYGTIDDYVTNPSATGNIGSVKVRGNVGFGAGLESTFVASGTIDKMNLGAHNHNAGPLVWEQAASQNIPLELVTTALNSIFSSQEIWVAVFGQEIFIPQPGQSLTGPTYFLDPTTISNGEAHRTLSTTLTVSASTPNLAILPSASLSTWQDALNLHLPAPGRQFTGRILISAGAPVQAQVNADGSVASPSASDPSDPSTGTFYDFLEFTVTNNGGVPNLDIDTSQVDSFGFPMGLQFFQKDGSPFHVPVNGTVLTANSPTISNLVTTGLSAGQPIYGGALPSQGARILSVVASTGTSANGSITISQNYPTAGPVSLTAYAAGPVGVIAPRDVILTGNTNEALLTFISGQVAGGNEQARPFLQSAAPFAKFAPVPITFASNAGPIVISTNSVAGLVNGNQVVISGVQGNTAANGTFTIGQVNSTTNTFELVGSTGNGTYVAGGAWSMAITGASHAGPIVIGTTNTLGLHNGDLVEIAGVAGNTAANGFFFVSNVTPTGFTLDHSNGNAVYTSGGTWKVYTIGNRLAAPKDVVEALTSPQDSNGLNNYFNKAIDDFFKKYSSSHGGQTFSLVSEASGTSRTYSGQVTNMSTANGGHVLRLNTAGDNTNYDIYYPFFSTNAPSDYTPVFGTPAPPSWIKAAGQQFESASQMIFGCDAVFADNIARGFTGTASAVLGDLENSISAAFNRGISLSDPSTWSNTTAWFPPNGTYNYWVQFWHQTGLTYSDLAYAFPYDDKFGTSTNLNQNNVGKATITLGSWTSTTIKSTTTFDTFPTSATLQGPISLTAQVAAANSGAHPLTGTVTFFINGVPINSNDNSASPPLQPVPVDGTGKATISATLPVMPDGNTLHTYTVTAVYSGDAFRAPSVVYDSLQLAPAFQLGFSTNNVPLGTQITLDVTLGGSSYSGVIDFSISHADGTGQISLGSAVPVSALTTKLVTIPANLLQITGNIVTNGGVSSIQNVSNFTGLRQTQILAGAGLPSGTMISAFTKHQLTLSQPASPAGTGNVMLTVNGRTFPAYIPPTAPSTVNGIDMISDLQPDDVVSGIGIPSGTKIGQLISGNITLSKVATDGNGITITSNAANAAFPITVTYKPTTGSPISTTANIAIVP
jgi:Beta-1,3-glucanase